MKKHLANIITSTRLIGTIALIFTEPLSDVFFAIYIWCGISDILDIFAIDKESCIAVCGCDVADGISCADEKS